jgi:hypothetical protein
MLNFFLGISLALTADAKITVEDPDMPANPLVYELSQVELAAVRYRVQVYQTFRQNRPEYEARQAAGREVLMQWSKAGKPAGFVGDVTAWFDSARQASTLPQVDSIPHFIDLPKTSFISSEEDAVPSPSDIPPLSNASTLEKKETTEKYPLPAENSVPENTLDGNQEPLPPEFDFDDEEFSVPVNKPSDAVKATEANDGKESKVLGVIGRSLYNSLPGT